MNNRGQDNQVNNSATWSAQGSFDNGQLPFKPAPDPAEVSAIIRHDMVNCLSGMRLHIEVMRRKKIIDEIQTDLLVQYLARMELLIHDWQRLSNVQQPQNDHVLFNLVDVLNNMIEANHECMILKSQLLSVDLGYTPAVMIGDRSQIQRAIDNVISNAVKYTPEGGTISISLVVQFDKAVISIQDNGIGIAEDEQALVFKGYFRAHNATSNQISGTGLGLTQAKDAVEQHGGTIHLYSEYGQGTRVMIHLPLKAEQRITIQ